MIGKNWKIFNPIFPAFRLIILLLIATGCDTEDNVDPRFERFFIKYYGEQGDQIGTDLIETADGGYLIVGTTDPDRNFEGDEDVFLVKTDILGNELWNFSIGRSKRDDGVSLVASPAGDYIVAANSTNDLGNIDVVLFRIADGGVFVDSAIFGNPLESDIVNKISMTTTGFIVAGSTTNVDIGKSDYDPITDLTDLFSIKLDNNLMEDPIWTNVLGFAGIDDGVGVFETSFGFAFIGSTDKPTPNDVQKAGVNIFSFPAGVEGLPSGLDQIFGSLDNETAQDVIKTSVNGFAVIGTTTSGTANDIYLVRLRSDLSFEDQGSIGSNFNVKGKSLAEATGGGFFVVGEADINGQSDIYLSKIATRRAIVWETTFGENSDDFVGGVHEAIDGGVLIVGTVTLETQKKIVLIKAGPNGELRP